MATFYIKTEAGEYVEADDKVDEKFREESGRIVAKRLNEVKEKEIAKAREEIEQEVREKTTETIKSEVRGEIEKEFQEKLNKAESENKELGIRIRQKTIAAEYGFKPETEKYLGNGTEEEMRKEADNLKKSFGADSSVNAPEKHTSERASKFKESTGLDITIK